MKVFLILLLVGIVFVSGCSSGKVISDVNNVKTGINVGDNAPKFSVTSIDGKEIKLSELTKNKRPLVLYFFAAWCPFCTEELKNLKSVYPDFSSKVDFVAVDLDLAENLEVIKNYRDKRGYFGDFAPGNRQILSDYGVSYTTTKYAINRNGIILYKASGILSDDNWRTLFSELSK